uniref:Transmembrane protein 235 n=1 Tax=Nothobranchius furzeri TaxID=105023 RepID=A0A8C6NX19_NOTFU
MVTFGALVTAAGVCGLLSFAFLATSLGTDYWYIIEINHANMSDFKNMSSHSGLWSINEGEHQVPLMLSVPAMMLPSPCVHPADMHGAVVVMLPLSLVLLLFGGICGLVSSLARSPVLLTSTASYFFISSLLTLCGASLYIIYSYQALAETERLVGQQSLANIHTSFGWSLHLAWLSFSLEITIGALLLTAAQMAKLGLSPRCYKGVL